MPVVMQCDEHDLEDCKSCFEVGLTLEEVWDKLSIPTQVVLEQALWKLKTREDRYDLSETEKHLANLLAEFTRGN